MDLAQLTGVQRRYGSGGGAVAALDGVTVGFTAVTFTTATFTAVMVTHDPIAAAHAYRMVFLAAGRLVDELTGPTAASVAARMTGLAAVRAC